MKTIECKRVDLWDGGERHNFGFYIGSDIPDDAIKKTYMNCSIRLEVLTVFDSLEEVRANSTRELRKSAWRKMTPQERVAMNMIEEPK